MRIQYIKKRFKLSSRLTIDKANEIIEEYEAQGFSLTLRQLYYQFVARDLLENKQTAYKRLGSIINNARLAGHISWLAIEDRTRNLEENTHWDDPKELLDYMSDYYRIDMWENQLYRPEVWIEKQALIGIIDGVCRKLDVPYFACRGYTSQSEQWRAGQRLIKHIERGQIPIIFHLGDHDPSGVDMTRDNQDRLALFLAKITEENDVPPIQVNRIALNMDQVRQYSPPPNPAKFTDSRASEYVKKYGFDSWELDALSPKVISKLIENEITAIQDVDYWDDALARRDKDKEKLNDLSQQLEDESE